MNKRFLLGGLVLVLLAVVSLSVIGQNPPAETSDLPPHAVATPINLVDPNPPTIGIDTTMPTATGPTPEAVSAGDLREVPAAPVLGAVPAGFKVASSQAFDAADTSAWSFQSAQPDAIPAPAWTVKNGQLVAADNSGAMLPFNDTLAILGGTTISNGQVEAHAYSGTASKIGLVLGYQSPQSYIALLLNADQAAFGEAGLRLVQVSNGQTTVLAENKQVKLQRDRWYRLFISIEGSTLRAGAGDTQLSAKLPAAPQGQQVGLYSGFEGYAFFDNLRVIVK